MRRAETGERRAECSGGGFLLSPLSLLLSLFLASCATTHPPMHDFDLKITNGRVIDGTGAPWFRADVGIRGDQIVAIGDLSGQTAGSTTDAHHHIVPPGFIDLLGQSQSSVFVDPTVEAKVRQGVTTEVTGEGESPGPSNAPKARWPRLRDHR